MKQINLDLFFPAPLCACGCGGRVGLSSRTRYNTWNKFIFGHWNKGRIISESVKLRISKTLTGRKATVEARLNIAKSLKGRVFSEEHRKNLSLKSAGCNNGMWGGGKFIANTGYIFIYKPDHPNAVGGYIQEHRLVMEHKLGRILKTSEVVHHIDEIPTNNNIDNLILFKNQSEHMKHHKFWLHRSNIK